MAEPPIQNIDEVDIVGQHEDGRVDLFIVVGSPLNASPEHQELLLAKIESYLQQLNSAEFRAEFKNPPDDHVRIVVSFRESPDPVIHQLIDSAGPWVQANHARLAIQIDSADPTLS